MGDLQVWDLTVGGKKVGYAAPTELGKPRASGRWLWFLQRRRERRAPLEGHQLTIVRHCVISVVLRITVRICQGRLK
jgi:hypothetical protein